MLPAAGLQWLTEHIQPAGLPDGLEADAVKRLVSKWRKDAKQEGLNGDDACFYLISSIFRRPTPNHTAPSSSATTWPSDRLRTSLPDRGVSADVAPRVRTVAGAVSDRKLTWCPPIPPVGAPQHALSTS